MCGIAGIWDRRRPPAPALAGRLEAMTATLAHRGPDDRGTFVDQASGIGLGHRRLAVIDCSPAGHQPMASLDGRYVVVTNGEIYNYVELRGELQRAGRSFRGGSDTEVLVAGFEQWGVERTLERANGMFALAVWDEAEQVLHLARDRFGEKPLYFGWAGQSFVFGSELKALRAHPELRAEIDRDALALYFRHNCVPAPWSIYRGVSKLLPGTVLTLGRATVSGHEPTMRPFWSLKDVAEDGARARSAVTVPAALDELQRVLSEAVSLRMRSDVPLGAFLSGGIDSSLVVALMQHRSTSKIRTFTIAFDDAGFDESRHAAAVAGHLGTEHTELLVTAPDALALVPSLAEMFDEPFADSSQVPQALLARLTRRHVTVALSGDGGDELFGGYNRYAYASRFWPAVSRLPLSARRGVSRAIGAIPPHRIDSLAVRLRPVLPGALRVRMPGTKLQKAARVLDAPDLQGVYRILASHEDHPTRLVLGASEPTTLLGTPDAWPVLSEPVERMLYLDAMTYLPDDILTKVDRATMAVNLESRLPFLDPAVAELAWRTPWEHKVHQGTGKWLLRQLLHRYVPAELVERPKAGFGIPVGDWLRGPLRSWGEDLLDPALLERQGYLDPEPVRQLWGEHQSKAADRPYELWDVLMFQAWLARWGPS